MKRLLCLALAAFGGIALAQPLPDPSSDSGPSPVVPTPPSPPQPPAPPEPVTHTVEAGDNPWSIAKKYGVALDALLALNEIKDPKNLKVGDVLKIPVAPADKTAATEPAVAGGTATAAAPESAAAPEAPADADWEWYTIAKGDNPWNIARARKVPHGKIVSLNKGVDFKRLAIGQRIKVPKSR